MVSRLAKDIKNGSNIYDQNKEFFKWPSFNCCKKYGRIRNFTKMSNKNSVKDYLEPARITLTMYSIQFNSIYMLLSKKVDSF
jgi:hypothetical protein